MTQAINGEIVPALSGWQALAARGASPAAFDGRCIPAGGVAPRSNMPNILTRRALPAGRLARLGATLDLHHGLLGFMAATFAIASIVKLLRRRA